MLSGVSCMTLANEPDPSMIRHLLTFNDLLHSGLAHDKAFLMLWTIAIILFVLWALGMVTSSTMGGFIHLLLVVAIISVLIRVIQGRKILGT
jgi:hypothetical protein